MILIEEYQALTYILLVNYPAGLEHPKTEKPKAMKPQKRIIMSLAMMYTSSTKNQFSMIRINGSPSVILVNK